MKPPAPRRPRQSPCGTPPPTCHGSESSCTSAGTGATLVALVDDYIARVRPRHAAGRKFDRSHKDLATAISFAALALTPELSRHAHQRRIPGHALAAADRRLQRARLGNCIRFSDLHAAVKRVGDAIDGLGELWTYDTALRIGNWLEREPDMVYLHSGTRVGARNLGLDHHAASIALEALPAELQQLSPAECEDFLCIYKDRLQATARPPTVR